MIKRVKWMNEWWEKKKSKSRKAKKEPGTYTFVDFIWDVLSWIPELIILPFRIIFWIIRGAGRMIADFFDFL